MDRGLRGPGDRLHVRAVHVLRGQALTAGRLARPPVRAAEQHREPFLDRPAQGGGEAGSAVLADEAHDHGGQVSHAAGRGQLDGVGRAAGPVRRQQGVGRAERTPQTHGDRLLAEVGVLLLAPPQEQHPAQELGAQRGRRGMPAGHRDHLRGLSRSVSSRAAMNDRAGSPDSQAGTARYGTVRVP
jgi:hypothetical protein